MFLTDDFIEKETKKCNDKYQTNFAVDSSVIDENYQTIIYNYNSKYIVITIDSKGNYYLFDSNNEKLLEIINMKIIFMNKKKLDKILVLIYEFFNSNKKKEIVREKNPYNTIFPTREKSKEIIDMFLLEKKSEIYRENISKLIIGKIPKKLLYNPSNIFKMISNEVISINTNMDHLHSIRPDADDIYNLIVKLKFKDKNNKKIFETINEKYGYNYLEFKLIIDPFMYPFLPPKIEYRRPKISHLLLYSLNNLSVLKLKNWNPTISIEALITDIHENLLKEDILKDNIIINSELNSKEISFNELDINLVKLSNISGEEISNKIDFQFNSSKINYSKKEKQKYFAKGTGYGYDGTSTWDIESYLKEQEEESENISIVLSDIASNISEKYDMSDIINNSVLLNFICNKFRGTTLLEIEKNYKIYESIIKILNTEYFQKKDNFNQKTIDKIGKVLKPISNDISNMLKMKLDNKKLEVFLKINSVAEFWIQNLSDELKTGNTDDDYKKEFENEMKKIQVVKFDDKISDFYYSEKISSIEYTGNTCLRIVNEWSTFKNLPIYWDSTVFIRYFTESIAGLKFMITGPKNTPYENGLYEFHAYYPKEYPDTEPKVNFMTTGGNKVRFNPNLYDSGKVCLSLLGTWSGGKDEKWNKTSNMFTVICSIQGQILGVDFPYYNEPGWEKQMYTEKGKKKAFEYNDLRRYKNLQVAINNQIEKPPKHFEDVIKKYFVHKEKEIMERCTKWAEESLEYKKEIEKEIVRFQALIKGLKESK